MQKEKKNYNIKIAEIKNFKRIIYFRNFAIIPMQFY